MTVLISRLRGLSKFQGSNLALGLNTQELDDILDTNQSLQLLSHHILRLTTTELHQYTAFSAWFHKEIELRSSDSTSSTHHDSLERESSIDHAATLQYIQGAMCQSRLRVHLQERTTNHDYSKWNISAGGRSLYALYRGELGNMENASETSSLPGLDSLIEHMSSQCGKLFSRIAETQRRNVRFGNAVPISSNSTAFAEARVISEVCLHIYYPCQALVCLTSNQAGSPEKFSMFVISGTDEGEAQGE